MKTFVKQPGVTWGPRTGNSIIFKKIFEVDCEKNQML